VLAVRLVLGAGGQLGEENAMSRSKTAMESDRFFVKVQTDANGGMYELHDRQADTSVWLDDEQMEGLTQTVRKAREFGLAEWQKCCAAEPAASKSRAPLTDALG
jgi:hypothetical protein